MLVFAVAPFLMQCASQDDLTLIHAQLRSIDNKLTELETTTVDGLRKRQASNTAQIDQLNQELLALRGGLEETGHLNRRLKEQSKELEITFKRYAQQEEQKRLNEVKRLESEIAENENTLRQLEEDENHHDRHEVHHHLHLLLVAAAHRGHLLLQEHARPHQQRQGAQGERQAKQVTEQCVRR